MSSNAGDRKSTPWGARAGLAIVWVALLGGARPARADGLSLVARAGSPGLGLEATASLGSRINLRGGFNVGSLGHELDARLTARSTQPDVHFSGDARLQSGTLLADVYATKAFHLTGGMVYNRNRVHLAATPNVPVTINDHTYMPHEVGTLDATVTLGKSWAPYAGVGFGNPNASGRRVSFLTDVGVVFEGQPTLALRSSAANQAGLQADVDQAAAVVNRDHFDKTYLKLYPVVSVGVAVRLF